MQERKEVLDVFLEAISNRSPYDFREYSVNSLTRRLNKVLSDYHIDVSELEKRIRDDRHFVEEVIKRITVNTTELFRDPEAWHFLYKKILPPFREKKKISIWHPGCSTGQEVFSMMILLNELGLLSRSRIYASDLNSDVLETASKGEFKYRFNKEFLIQFEKVMNPVGKKTITRYDKYFSVNEKEDLIKMKPFLTEKPIYRKMDLVKDPNLFRTSFDIIVCRNVIIYFNYDLQNKVLGLFHSNLKRSGILFLGLHESIIGPYSSLFNKKEYVYLKNQGTITDSLN
jgi:chemotaxis protein methyltransferase CheR